MSVTNKEVRTGDTCAAVDEAVLLLGNKWTLLVLGALSHEPAAIRYNELQRAVGGISQRMLTLTLKQLEASGLVSRTVFPTVPPRVDYALTPLGVTLSAQFGALLDWVDDNRHAMVEARRAYAKKSVD